MQVYIFKIAPKEYNNGLTIAFNKKPTKEQIVTHINKLIAKSKNQFFIDLCTKCKNGVDTFGVPGIHENNEGVMHWKDKGMSQYSSKGCTLVKIINIVEI